MRQYSIKPKKRNRRLKEPLKARLKRSLLRITKVTLATLAIPAVSYGGWWAYRQAVTTPYLAIHDIVVKGSRRVSKEEVLKLSGIRLGQNILSFSAKEAADSIRANPWIEDALIDRNLPGSIAIEVRERYPVAIVKLGSLYVMDINGVVFKRLAREDSLDLPVVTGLTMEGIGTDSKGLQEGVIEIIRTLTERKGFDITRVSEINVDPVFGLSVYTLEGGVRLTLGMGGTGSFEQKLKAFERILRSRNGVLDGVEAMDLTTPGSVLVRFNTNIVQEGGEAHGKKG